MNEETYKLLNGMISDYYQNKKLAENSKKYADRVNLAIKDKMQQMNITEFEGDDFKAKVSIQKRESFNEAMLVDKLKQLKANAAIKTIEVVDMDELENLIYNGQVNAGELKDCKQVKEITVLKVTEKRG